jgi:hypothetical protein
VTRLKTIAFWVFSCLALGIGVYAYFNLKNNKKPEIDALSVIPDKCLIYLNTHNFFELNKKINSQSLIVDKLKLFGDIDFFCTTLQSFDSLFSSEESLREELNNNLIHFAYYDKNSAWLAAFNLKRLGKQDAITEHLSTILKASKNTTGIYTFKVNQKDFYFDLKEGVALLSNSVDLLKLSLNKSESKFQNTVAYKEFKNTLSENSLLSVFVDHGLYSQSKASARLNLSITCKNGHSAGIIDLQPSQIKINGYLQPDSSEVLSLFRDQSPQSTEDLTEFLPANTLSLKAFGFSSFKKLQIKLTATEDNVDFWTLVNYKALYDLENEFNDNLNSHLVHFETTSPKQSIIAVGVSETFKAREHLTSMSDSLITTDSLLVYQLTRGVNNADLCLFAPLLNDTTNFAVVYHGHIFFSASREKLVQLLVDLKNNRLLLNNESFVSYKNQHFSQEFNYLIYNSPNRITDELNDFFNFASRSKEPAFENFKHFSFSVSNNSKNFKFRLQLMNESETRTKTQNILWTMNMDTTGHSSMCGFINHITGENEVIVQDDNNMLYLINAKGTVLWKKQLNEHILSTIYTVDIYKKNKYQLLFNTKNYLHLIDRNGNYVEQYPIKLPAEATCKMSLYDYDNDKDYRIFIACKNNLIYNYSIHGVKQEKFIPVKTNDEVNTPVQYVKVGSSDYLVTLDKEGKIYTFSRKGAERIGLRNRTIVNCSAYYVDAGNSLASTHLVYLDDKSGLISKVSFDDKKEIAKLNIETENASVNFSLIDQNKNMDMLITKNNSIYAFNLTGNLILEKTSDIALSKSSFYGDESHSVFYSLSEGETELRVYNELSSETKTFKATALPFISNLFNDNKKYMLITNGSRLNCVQLN